MNDKEEIICFLKKIASQSNRCTAAPYFYVIRTSYNETLPIENCDETKFYDPENPDRSFDSEEECSEEWLKIGATEEEIQKVINRLEEYGIGKRWREEGMFLTETDAKDHLKSNYYHYSDDAHTYVKHAWRAPELETFFKNMFRYFDVDKGNLDLRMEE